jgi:hypothetical protein
MYILLKLIFIIYAFQSVSQAKVSLYWFKKYMDFLNIIFYILLIRLLLYIISYLLCPLLMIYFVSLLIAHNKYTKWMWSHCDISIYTYNIFWSNSCILLIFYPTSFKNFKTVYILYKYNIFITHQQLIHSQICSQLLPSLKTIPVLHSAETFDREGKVSFLYQSKKC